MKRTIVFALVLGLVAGSIAMPATAKKKKKKKPVLVESELKYFLHWEDDGAGGCDGLVHMNLQDTEDPGSGCEFIAQPAQELLIATGQGALTRDWPADEGLPFILDAKKKITGEIALRGAAAVQAKVDLVLTAVIGGESVEIATGSTVAGNGAVTGQTGPIILTFELEPDPAFDGKTVEGLSLNTATRGVTVATYIALDNPASFLVVPVLVQK